MWARLAFENLSLKYKFLFVFLAMVTLPTICFGSFIYIQMNEVLKTQIHDSTEGMLDKIEGNLTSIIQDVENITSYAIYNEDFRTFMTAPEKDYNEPFYTQSVDNVKGYFTFQLLSNAYINSIAVQGNNDNWIDFGEPVSGDETEWDNLAMEKHGGIFWSDAYKLSSGWNKRKKSVEVVTSSRVINDYNNINKSIGFIKVRLDTEKLRELIALPGMEETGDVYLRNTSNDIFLTSNNKEKERDIIDKLDNGLDAHPFSIDGQDYSIVIRNLDGVDWDLVAVVNQKEVAAKLVNVKRLMRNMVITLTLLGLIALIGYYYADIRRIIALTKTTEKIGQKDFSVKVNVNSKDEIGQLGMRFNQMIHTIRTHIDKEYKLKIKQRESEMKALQSQIDPHFLYNTLDMIRWKARLEKAPETSYLIEMLSQIFRNTLKNDKLYVTLDNELSFIQTYLGLQSKRMNDKLLYRIYSDPETKNLYIVKQTIQPLVENAIKHGFLNQKADRMIKVRCYTINDTLNIDVIDNGVGMTQQKFIESIETEKNHALKNLHDRIHLAFGSTYGLSLVAMDRPGTWIKIEIPIMKNDPDVQRSDFGQGENRDD